MLQKPHLNDFVELWNFSAKGNILLFLFLISLAAFCLFICLICVLSFAHSIPQLLIQTYMFAYEIKVNERDLIISIIVSSIHLFYNLYQLRKEAKYHGMTFVQYSISVLHLGFVTRS